MSRQQFLWVILSITLLLIIVLIGSLLLLSNKPLLPIAELRRSPFKVDDRFEYPLDLTAKPLFAEDVQEKTDPDTIPLDIQNEEKLISSLLDGKESPAPTKLQNRPSFTPRPKEEVKKTSSSQPPKQKSPIPRLTSSYWIQAGSYTSKSKAEQLSELLVINGIYSYIFTKQISGTTYFRVRIGPFVNKAEANKFITWIKKIEGLENSYLVIEYSLKK